MIKLESIDKRLYRDYGSIVVFYNMEDVPEDGIEGYCQSLDDYNTFMLSYPPCKYHKDITKILPCKKKRPAVLCELLVLQVTADYCLQCDKRVIPETTPDQS